MPEERRGNDLPPVVDQDTAITSDREDMLYSYQNTVQSSYVGDIRHIVSKFGDYLKTKNAFTISDLIFDMKFNNLFSVFSEKVSIIICSAKS